MTKSITDTITQRRVQELFKYDSEQGILYRKMRTGLKKAGTLSGTGYWIIYADKKRYQAHRLIWLYVNGYLPQFDVDHIDGNRLNNCFSNLRECSRSENRQNLTATKRNTVGILGVSSTASGKYLAQIQVDGQKHHLGTYATVGEARDAYAAAKKKLHIFHPIVRAA